MSDVTTSSMHDARDAEDTRLLEAGEVSLLVEGYYGVILDRCRVKVEVHDGRALAGPALQGSATSDLSAYDAFYAVLAEALEIPLVTADRRLAAAVPGALLVA